jgi:hypothetical protein
MPDESPRTDATDDPEEAPGTDGIMTAAKAAALVAKEIAGGVYGGHRR